MAPKCGHRQVTSRHKKVGGPWPYACPSCKRRSVRGGLREAFRAFVERYGAPVRWGTKGGPT